MSAWPEQGDRSRLFLLGLGTWLPTSRETVRNAVEAGSYDPQRADKDDFTSVAVEPAAFPAEMGVTAARRALEGVDVDTVDWLAWTSIHRHGHTTLWPPASFAHHELQLSSAALAFSLSQGCNAAFVAMRIAADHLRLHPRSAALIIGADRFGGSLFKRWSSDSGTVFGDAASAVVLAPRPGPLEILHLDVEQGSELERLYRFEQPSEENGQEPGRDYDVSSAKRAYLRQYGDDRIRSVFAQALGSLRSRLLARFPLLERPARFVVYPNVGRGISASVYEDIFGGLAEANCWEYGRSIGHTGVSDQILALSDLVERKVLSVGDRVLLIGAGNGLSVAVMLVEVRSCNSGAF
ncbi:ketoacyl-ACP synthase III family protein [Rathayibacter tritici]|uniref:3-oxoacyl-ACP synthase n=1 Tax=Rathayibacter tritici TaxID=33888 RepID=A0A160KUB5_9MICO|nr:ketoacyl-ACP synthase III family protein [Rathayibacter tritici]AND17134.1 hypothetical protein A6122_2009 [Rathayibacter tritici]PPI44550.1 hypothetical protein C5D18_07715 [Rathayibacter tritici]